MLFTHVTSDTHFFHEKIKRIGLRPFSSLSEMNDALISGWNAVVPKDGVVLHLGDFAHDNVDVDDLRRLRGALNGRIIMTLGNHDPVEKLVAAGVVEMRDIRYWFRSEDKSVTYSHQTQTPIMLFDSLFSVHGHTHRLSPALPPEDYPSCVSVNVEETGYAPLSSDELEARIAALPRPSSFASAFLAENA